VGWFWLTFWLSGVALLASCASVPAPTVAAVRETQAVSAAGDAADDPAIFIHPQAERSRVVATQKQGGLYVFDLMGRIVQEIPGGRPNNVDLRAGFPWPEGAAPIVGASDRSDNAIVLWRLNPETGDVEPAPRARIPTGFTEVYGFCLGRDASGAFYAVATEKEGEVGVWAIAPRGATFQWERVVAFTLGSITEGCVVDDEAGVLYLAQELVGIWRTPLTDATGAARRLVDRVGEGRLVADVEGLTLYLPESGPRYLIASVQGRNRYAVYERDGENAYVGSFKVGASADGRADAVSGTDGIDVTAAPLGPDFPRGLFVVQDDENRAPSDLQNFKYVSWADIEAALTEAREAQE
jgi:3-phytase